MSSDPRGKRKDEREPVRQKARSATKKPAARQRWIAHPVDPGYLIPSGKAEKYPEDATNLLRTCTVGGVIRAETLYATAIDVEEIELGEHTPRRPDYVYLHPDTMKLCAVGIAQFVTVSTVDQTVVTVCKAWPAALSALDVVAMSRAARLSLQASPASLVEVRRLPRPSALQTAKEIHLRPQCGVTFSLNTSFKSYLLHSYNGCFVCAGNIITVRFYGEERDFEVVMVTPSSTEGQVDSFSDSTREDALSLNLSGLSLEATPTKGAHGCAVASTPKHGMEAGVQQSSCESVPGHQDLGMELGQEAHDGMEWRLREIAYKVTPQTKIQFTEKEASANQVRSGKSSVEWNTVSQPRWPRLSDVGGLHSQVQLLKELVVFPLQHPDVVESQGLQLSSGVLLYGPSGVGKTLLVRALANEINVYTAHVAAADLLLSVQDSDNKLQEIFTNCQDNGPSLLVIDDLHALALHRDHTPSEAERRVTASLVSLMDQVHTASRRVVVMATTNQIDAVEPSLRRPGRFGKQIDIPVPSAGDREEILGLLLRDVAHSLTKEEVTRIADAAHGHVGADLQAVCMEAQLKALRRCVEGGGEGVRVCWEDMWIALREVRPSAMREITLEVPKVLWSDVGGQEEIKQKLRESVEWPLTHPEAFSRLGIRPPRGVLLYGPPGCSKTMIARALATESGLNFIAVKGPELFSKWVGDSERAVRQAFLVWCKPAPEKVFRRARAAAPAIVFFDEIDALAVSRTGSGSHVADRVLAQLLTEMDGVEALQEVLVVAATNRPDLIDKALLRPGRIDRIIYVPLPSTDTRREILKLQFRKTPVSGDVALEGLVQQTEGYSGAEVVSVCQEAALCAMHEDISAPSVSGRHFQQALAVVKPQTDPSTVEFYESYHRAVGTKGTR